jgi:uncharacterized protein (DUF2237 family)
MHKIVYLLFVIFIVYHCIDYNTIINNKEGLINFDEVDSVQGKTHPSLVNIYGDPLQECKTSPDNGSWDSKGYCSEMGGGVHQICFKVTDKTKDFSKDTGQSDWSTKRVGNNHCMCLGAFALYTATEKGNLTGNDLQCDSIMKQALDESYVGNWGTWNGNEVDDQIVDGVNEIMNQCYKGTDTFTPTPQQKEYLQNLYQTLTRDRQEFHKTDIYNLHKYESTYE